MVLPQNFKNTLFSNTPYIVEGTRDIVTLVSVPKDTVLTDITLTNIFY
jgi:hypothetical protein